MPKPGTESKLGPSLCRCRRSVPATISPDRLLLSLFNLPHAYFVLRVFGLRGEHGLSQALQIKSNTYFLRQLAGESCGLAIVGPPVVCFDHHPHSAHHALDHWHTVAIGRSICNRTAVSSDRRRHHGLPHHGLKCQSQRNGNTKTSQARFEPVSHFVCSAGGKLFGPSVTPRR